jgi:hypothetical protein
MTRHRISSREVTLPSVFPLPGGGAFLSEMPPLLRWYSDSDSDSLSKSQTGLRLRELIGVFT